MQAAAGVYARRISESAFEDETGVALSLLRLLGVETALGHSYCNAVGNCLNMSVCAYTTDHNKFGVFRACCVLHFSVPARDVARHGVESAFALSAQGAVAGLARRHSPWGLRLRTGAHV